MDPLPPAGHSIPFAAPHESRRVVEEQLTHAWEDRRRRLEAAADAEGARAKAEAEEARAKAEWARAEAEGACAEAEAEGARAEAARAAERMDKENYRYSYAKEEAEGANEECLSGQQQPPTLGCPPGSGDRPYGTVALVGGRVRSSCNPLSSHFIGPSSEITSVVGIYLGAVRLTCSSSDYM